MKRQIVRVFLAGVSASSQACRRSWLTKNEQFLPLKTVLLEGFSVKTLHLVDSRWDLKTKEPSDLTRVFFAYLMLLVYILKKNTSASLLHPTVKQSS